MEPQDIAVCQSRPTGGTCIPERVESVSAYNVTKINKRMLGSTSSLNLLQLASTNKLYTCIPLYIYWAENLNEENVEDFIYLNTLF